MIDVRKIRVLNTAVRPLLLFLVVGVVFWKQTVVFENSHDNKRTTMMAAKTVILHFLTERDS